MKINWKVRIKNKSFWMAIVPMMILLIQQVAKIFGYEIDMTQLGEQLVAVIGTVFGILALIGIVNDPTTRKLSDSEQALTYTEPK